jgi:uncharacterized glyoxalase superfamily protein PhnB/uncharacterized protein YndB with AHSA1/START domain
MNNTMQIKKDLPNKKIYITRTFDAPQDLVWRAWTEPELLDLWWAPKPYRAETKTMQFKEGGYWHYAMVGPEGDKNWVKINYVKINPIKSYEAYDCFCDEAGNPNTDFPSMSWKNEFREAAEGTEVVMEITFSKIEDLKMIVEMGFESGFASALTNLDHYISTQFKLRKEMKTSNKARVTTYLNFPGNTEEAFLFYQKVFNGTFTGHGLKHFSEIEMPAGSPPMSEEHKKLIIHAELTIMGGHVLMATDAPESMGFKMVHGNNMHINLEPESREETQRLFDALSEGGTVTMPLEDMVFFGAYYGSCTDKYGINWMLNYQLRNEEA